MSVVNTPCLFSEKWNIKRGVLEVVAGDKYLVDADIRNAGGWRCLE